jgi:hypothetical protein
MENDLALLGLVLQILLTNRTYNLNDLRRRVKEEACLDIVNRSIRISNLSQLIGMENQETDPVRISVMLDLTKESGCRCIHLFLTPK